jgi:hypothetical protein
MGKLSMLLIPVPVLPLLLLQSKSMSVSICNYDLFLCSLLLLPDLQYFFPTYRRQQSSLSPKVLGSAAAAHGKGRTTLNNRRRGNTNDAHNDNATNVHVSDPSLMSP